MSQSLADDIVKMVDDQDATLAECSTVLLNDHNSLNGGRPTSLLSPNMLTNSQPFPTGTQRSKSDENPCNKIFVGGLSWDTTQEKLYEYFSEFGAITDCILMLDGATGRSRGFGFVTFVHQESVKSVLSFKDHILDNKAIDPKEAVPKHIKDIENRVNSNQSHCHASAPINNHSCSNGCGGFVNGGENDTISVTVPTKNISNGYTHSNAKSLTKPFLSQRSSCVGEQVILPTNNPSFCQHNSIPSTCFLSPNVLHNTKIFVGGIGHVSEVELRSYFSTFGTVVDVNIMMDKSTGRPRGFAFVGFSTSEAADLTASIRYHYVRNKQVEVKKALPKDAKHLSSINHGNAVVSAAASTATPENHPLTSHSHLHSNITNNSKNSFNLTSYPSENNNLKSYVSTSCDYQKQQQSLYHVNNPKLNSTFDEGIVGHELPISTAITPIATANCSLVSGGSTVCNDERAINILQSATAYEGEWDFDDVLHLDDSRSTTLLTTANINQKNSFFGLSTSPGNAATGVTPLNNTAQPNNPINCLKTPLSGTFNGNASLHRHSNPLSLISNNPTDCRKIPQGCGSILDSDHCPNISVASACVTTNTVMDHLHPMRFSSVGDTTTLLNRQIPDDTKNSIVELLNEIWKGTG